MGLVPQSAAKPASLWKRSGLEPTVMSSWATVRGPVPWAARVRGARGGDQSGDVGLEVGDLGVEGHHAAREAAQGSLGGLDGVAELGGVDAEPGAVSGQGLLGQPGQGGAQGLWAGDADLVHLVDRGGALLGGRGVLHLQHPQGFDDAVVDLGGVGQPG